MSMKWKTFKKIIDQINSVLSDDTEITSSYDSEYIDISTDDCEFTGFRITSYRTLTGSYAVLDIRKKTEDV